MRIVLSCTNERKPLRATKLLELTFLSLRFLFRGKFLGIDEADRSAPARVLRTMPFIVCMQTLLQVIRPACIDAVIRAQ